MPKKKVSEKSEPKPQFMSSSRELPATQGMLQLVRSELKADIRGLSSEMKAGFIQMDSKFERVLSEFEHVRSDVARVGILVEEQNSNNRVVLEGLTGLWQRQERIEVRVDDVEKLVRSIGRPRT